MQQRHAYNAEHCSFAVGYLLLSTGFFSLLAIESSVYLTPPLNLALVDLKVNSIVFFMLSLGTYCQQREVEAITEGVEDDDDKLDLRQN